MTRTEERLADALAARAAAVAADSIRPLPGPAGARFRRLPSSRPWSASLAPIAAAAAIAAITAIVMLPQHHEPGRALTGMPKNSALLGVAAVSASDAWAVGLVRSGRRTLPLIMRWNGTTWTRSPISAPVKGELWGVAAASARDAWAVGASSILHWNGSEWAPVPLPRVPVQPLLWAVAVVSATDAWAVGQVNDGAVILHWDGTKWLNFPNPWLRGRRALFGVFARSADDVWAVGTARSNSLILHWNGVSWSRLGGPKFGRYGSGIFSVTAVSSRLTWLVGVAKDGLPLIVRWKGTGVSAASARQGWAVGAGNFHGLNSPTWIFRWQGHGWLRVLNLARRVAGHFHAIFAQSDKNAWAVGYTGFSIGSPGSRGLILHWNGSAWRAAA